MQHLPRWANRLLERNPDAKMPTRDNPIPEWLAEESARTPLWYIIREASEVRDRHPFLLHKEIHRQPGQWREILDDHWSPVTALADELADLGIERIITTGCGSAYFTAIHGSFTLARLTGLPTMDVESYELTHYFPAVEPATTLVIGHSGTGGSIETVQAMRTARERGCHTMAFTNTEDTAVARASERVLTYVTSQECGPCTSVVSTRILLQTMLGLALGERRGVEGVPIAELREALGRVPETGQAFLDGYEDAVAKLAGDYKDVTAWLLVGSGPHYFSAREGTLKIEEQAILTGKAYRTGDFHHDVLSQLAPERAVVAIEAGGAANERVVDAVRAARQGLSPTIAVTWSGGDGATELEQDADHAITLTPALPELISPIPMTLVFQLLGYYLGVERGYNPDTLRTDNPPNTRAWLTSFPLGTH